MLRIAPNCPASREAPPQTPSVAVQRHSATLRSRLRPERHAFAQGRTGALVPPSHPLSRQFLGPAVVQRIADLTGLPGLAPVPDRYPLELRRYVPGPTWPALRCPHCTGGMGQSEGHLRVTKPGAFRTG